MELTGPQVTPAPGKDKFWDRFPWSKIPQCLCLCHHPKAWLHRENNFPVHTSCRPQSLHFHFRDSARFLGLDGEVFNTNEAASTWEPQYVPEDKGSNLSFVINEDTGAPRQHRETEKPLVDKVSGHPSRLYLKVRREGLT